MAVLGQGAPGVRIQLRDLSQIDLVTEPIVTGGIVGFSSRGEFNKIIDISSTADMDVILGSGFNNPQFNQGLYAARAVVQAGGFVEFVRPYGEEIIQDDNDSEYPYNQKLKTDTYLVEYNFTTPDVPTLDTILDSFSTTYMASTRYIEDLLQGLGEREIHTISETIQKNTNLNFFLDADDTLIDDDDTVSLFAIMNSDPTAARRAGDRFDISSIKANGTNVDVSTKNAHGLTSGEIIYITGTTGFNGQFVVNANPGAKTFSYTETSTALPESDGAVYINEDTIQSGVDYLEVKTAARGKSSKKLDNFILDGIPLDLVTPTSVATADSLSDTIVTVNLVAHGLDTGDTISVEGSSISDIDGIYEITVNSTSAFTYTVTGITLGVNAPTLFFAELGNQLFTVLLPDGTKVLNEYTTIGQEPLSIAEVGEIGPVGLPVIKSNITSFGTFSNLTTDTGVVEDTFDAATAAFPVSNSIAPTGSISNFAEGDKVFISGSTLPDFTPAYTTGFYTVDVISGSGMTLIDSDGVTPVTFTAVGTDVAAVVNNVENTYITVADINLPSVGNELNITAGTGTLPSGLTAGTKIVASVDGSKVSLFESDGITPVVITNSPIAGVGTSDVTNLELSVFNGGLFTVGDTVRFQASEPTFTPAPTAPITPQTENDYVIAAVNGNFIQLNDYKGISLVPNTGFQSYSTLVNMTGTNNSMISAWTSNGLNNVVVRSTFIGGGTESGVTIGSGAIVVANASKFEVADQVIFSDIFDANGTTSLPTGIDNAEIYIVSSIDLMSNTVTFTGLTVTAESTGEFQITNLTQTQGSTAFKDPSNSSGREVDFIGVLGLKIPEVIQDEPSFTFFRLVKDGATTPLAGIINVSEVAITLAETTNDIMLDSSVGRTFLALGLANEDYVDTDFDGDEERVFRLNDDGIQAARFFLFCEYFFAGETYNFAGTILPLVVNGTNLFIGDSANDVSNGWTFQINQNASLQAAADDSGFDLSQSVKDGTITSEFAQIAFNENDPAVINDAVWQYNPNNNKDTLALAESWNLFLDRDNANADMLISAGTTIQNLFVRGFEQINYGVMDSILNVCEKRKDMFSVFDGIDAPDIDVALRKMVGIGSQGEIARWGGIFDGRDIFFDSNYTKLNVQAVKSISVAAIITLNRAGNVYWLPCAGYTTGRIPAQYSLRQKYLRSYNYAADPNSDIARLYDANINPTRVNDQGQFIYGQKTMLKRGSALNRMNVIMLIAGIHKRFENYLDFKVFQLNTAALRNNIQSDLQAQLELIKAANPQGITAGQVICDATNNTPDIIDTNQLIVDVVLQPTRAAEFITLRTTVQRTGADLDVTNTILGG